MSPRDESSSLALPHNHPARRLPRRRNINRLPFRRSGRHFLTKSPACKNGTTLSLRTGSPASKCCSRGTLLHFSLQSSHLNICYCHQDLHQGRLHATSQSAASPQYNQASTVHAVIPRAQASRPYSAAGSRVTRKCDAPASRRAQGRLWFRKQGE